MPILKKGLVQVYTGDGKGKTTAAFGLACRMLGAGGRVYICQFLKPPDNISGEMCLSPLFADRLTIDRIEQDWNLCNSLADPDQVEKMRQAISNKLTYIKELSRGGRYDLMILDEIVFCLSNNLAPWPAVLAIIDSRAEYVEFVLTGRGADGKLLARADLVTQMRSIKHPLQRDIAARQTRTPGHGYSPVSGASVYFF